MPRRGWRLRVEETAEATRKAGRDLDAVVTAPPPGVRRHAPPLGYQRGSDRRRPPSP